MASHVYVNLTGGPVSLSLPSGSLFTLGAGEAVRGEWFQRHTYAISGFVPLEGVPRGTKIGEIHTVPGVDPVPPPEPLSPSQGEAAAAGSGHLVLESETEESAAEPEDTSPGELVDGRTVEEWREWFSSTKESSQLQLKLSTLAAVATALGADPGRTKVDALRAIQGAL